MTYVDAGGVSTGTGNYRSIDIPDKGDYIAIAYLVSESIAELPTINATITSGTVKKIAVTCGHAWGAAFMPIGVFAVHTQQNAVLTISSTETTATQHIAIMMVKIINS